MFSIPAFGEDTNAVQDELNSFLRGHRVISVDKQLVSNPEPVWCFCIEYIQGNIGNPLNSGFAGKKEKTDYRQILKGAEFDRFQKRISFQI